MRGGGGGVISVVPLALALALIPCMMKTAATMTTANTRIAFDGLARVAVRIMADFECCPHRLLSKHAQPGRSVHAQVLLHRARQPLHARRDHLTHVKYERVFREATTAQSTAQSTRKINESAALFRPIDDHVGEGLTKNGLGDEYPGI